MPVGGVGAPRFASVRVGAVVCSGHHDDGDRGPGSTCDKVVVDGFYTLVSGPLACFTTICRNCMVGRPRGLSTCLSRSTPRPLRANSATLDSLAGPGGISPSPWFSSWPSSTPKRRRRECALALFPRALGWRRPRVLGIGGAQRADHREGDQGGSEDGASHVATLHPL